VTTIDSKGLSAQFKAHLVASGLSSTTVINYMADLRAFLRWSEETRGSEASPFDLEPSDIQEYCIFLRDGLGRAPATVNRRIQALRKFYKFAVEQGWASTNPADEVALLSETVSTRSRGLSPDDVSRLMQVVRGGRRRWADRDWAILQTFLGAGLKLSELTQLLQADVHTDRDAPCLDVRDAAGQPARCVPLDAEVRDALQAYQASRRAAPNVEHFFVNRDGRPISTRSVQRLLRHYARTAELSELTTQSLRYLYARKAYDDSQNPETVARLLGHRHLATTVRYLRPSPTAAQADQGLRDVDPEGPQREP
jgi:integrase/recombinase XerC